MIQLKRSKKIVNFEDGGCDIQLGISLLSDINNSFIQYKNWLEYDHLEENLNMNKLKEISLFISYNSESKTKKNYEIITAYNLFEKVKKDNLKLNKIIKLQNNNSNINVLSILIHQDENNNNDFNYEINHILQKIKNFKTKNFIIKSKSSIINEKIKYLTKCIFKYIQLKFLKNLFSFNIFYIVDKNFNCYLYDVKNILLKNKNEIINLKNNNYNIELNIKHSNIIKNIKCHGIYCNLKNVYSKNLIDEKDDTNNIYIMESHLNKKCLIDYKSIILDLFERERTIYRIMIHFNNQNYDNISSYDEPILLKLRIFYNLNDIRNDRIFNKFSYSDLFKKVTICGFCDSIYYKINFLRIKNNENKNKNNIKENIKQIINEYLEKRDTKENINRIKKIFSKDFYEKIKNNINFKSKAISIPFPNELLISQKENFILKKKNLNFNNDNFININKERNSSILWLYLGMNKNFDNIDELPTTTYTSLKLSKLQNNLNKLDKINNYIKKGKLPIPEKDFLELIMIPFSKNNKKDFSKVESYKKEFSNDIKYTKLPLFIKKKQNDQNTHIYRKKININTKIIKLKEKEEYDRIQEIKNNDIIDNYNKLSKTLKSSFRK